MAGTVRFPAVIHVSRKTGQVTQIDYADWPERELAGWVRQTATPLRRIAQEMEAQEIHERIWGTDEEKEASACSATATTQP